VSEQVERGLKEVEGQRAEGREQSRARRCEDGGIIKGRMGR
jgi:hypothetical protein